MVDLAGILIDISESLTRPDDELCIRSKAARSMELEHQLITWKSQLPHELSFERSSLDESELITKQKIVLKLRASMHTQNASRGPDHEAVGFLNSTILTHRPFLITHATEPSGQDLQPHILSCVEAASETIHFVHAIYVNRPYFRTWSVIDDCH